MSIRAAGRRAPRGPRHARTPDGARVAHSRHARCKCDYPSRETATCPAATRPLRSIELECRSANCIAQPKPLAVPPGADMGSGRRFGPVPRPAATPPRNAGQSRARHRESGGSTVTDPLVLPLQHRQTERRSGEVPGLPSGCLTLRSPSTTKGRIGTPPIASSGRATSARGSRSCEPCEMRAAARSRPSWHPFIRYRRDSGVSRPSPRGASGDPSRIRSLRRSYAMRSRSNGVRRVRPTDAVPVRVQTRRPRNASMPSLAEFVPCAPQSFSPSPTSGSDRIGREALERASSRTPPS